MNRTWYRCKECNMDTERLEDNRFFCETCNIERTREEVQAGRTVTPGRSGTPISAATNEDYWNTPYNVLYQGGASNGKAKS
jgi:hypothetical protein